MTHPANARSRGFIPNPVALARLMGGIDTLRNPNATNPHDRTDARYAGWEQGRRDTLTGWTR